MLGREGKEPGNAVDNEVVGKEAAEEKPRRVFIAIEVPRDVQRLLATMKDALRPLIPRARWTRPESMHITVKFMGPLLSPALTEVETLLADVAARYGPGELPLQGLGGAPGLKRPRVVWVECLPEEALLQLQKELEERLRDLGFPRETRPFRPHVTLARLDARRFRPLAPLVLPDESIRQIQSCRIPVRELVLMESIPQQQGVRYEAIRRFPLAG